MRILFRDVLRVEHIGIGRECQERDHGTHGRNRHDMWVQIGDSGFVEMTVLLPF